MSRGPLPKPDGERRRRNAPTIPTTTIPIEGRQGDAPDPPSSYVLGEAGNEWWQWAWSTPQAAAWDPGSLYAIARRAQLEDELAAIAAVPEDTIGDILKSALGADLDNLDEVRELQRALEWLMSALQRRAGGSASVMREMRELDKRLGLDPKAVPELRWKFASTEKSDGAAKQAAPVVKTSGSRARADAAGLKVFDAALVDPAA